MAKSTFPTQVYWKSQLEQDQVKMRASLLGKKVSTYIRDLVITDLHYANLKPLLDTTENRAEVKRLQQLGVEDPSGRVYYPDEPPMRTTPYTQEEIDAASKAETPEDEEQRLMREIREGLLADNKPPTTDNND